MLLFDILRRYDLLNGLTLLLLLSCIGFLLYLNKYKSETELKKSIGIRIGLHIYFVFALIGNRLFMTQHIMNFGLLETVSFIIIAIALWPFGTIVILIFNQFTIHLSNTKKEYKISQIKKLKITSFFITLSILIIMSLAFFPAIMSTDGVSHWTQAVGYYKIYNNSPAAFTLLVRLCSTVWNSPYCYILLQLILFSLISSKMMSYFFTKGMSFRCVCCLSAIIAALPNNYITLSTLSKNPMYTILCIWATFLLIKLIEDPEKIGLSVKFIVEMSFILPCLYLCRYNSFIAVYSICIVLGVLCIKFTKYYKKLQIKFVIPIFVTVIVVKIVTGPIYSFFEVIPYTSSGITYPLISPLAVAYNNDVELTEDTLNYMSRIRPLEYWNQHIPYHGDYFNYSEPKPNYDQINGYTEKFKYYFKLLFSRPDIVIKDRLDGIESLWNVFPSKGQGAYNERYHLGIHSSIPKDLLPMNWDTTELNRWSAYSNKTEFATIPYAFCQYCESNTMLDSFIWRTGFSIILVFYAIYYSFINGQQKKIVASFPMLGTLLSLILPISWQLYQYFWVIHITNWFLIIYLLLPTESKQK